MPSASAHIHDAICAREASSVRAAWNTITAELAKPTSTVTKPAISAGSEASRHRERPAEEDIASPAGGRTLGEGAAHGSSGVRTWRVRVLLMGTLPGSVCMTADTPSAKKRLTFSPGPVDCSARYAAADLRLDRSEAGPETPSEHRVLTA
ncbi:hypothetical protein MO330_00730 [Xanthomonas translucens]|nr:hypothetical protein MO330_00730 [Xanthomonas translucens]